MTLTTARRSRGTSTPLPPTHNLSTIHFDGPHHHLCHKHHKQHQHSIADANNTDMQTPTCHTSIHSCQDGKLPIHIGWDHYCCVLCLAQAHTLVFATEMQLHLYLSAVCVSCNVGHGKLAGRSTLTYEAFGTTTLSQSPQGHGRQV